MTSHDENVEPATLRFQDFTYDRVKTLDKRTMKWKVPEDSVQMKTRHRTHTSPTPFLLIRDIAVSKASAAKIRRGSHTAFRDKEKAKKVRLI